jgi:hypothetical protein
LQRFADEGAWGLSPHFIPHRSQHAMSGTISQALKIHGPNFGAGGGPNGVLEALRAGAVLLHGDRLPGVFVIVTDWEPEFLPDRDGRPIGDTTLHAIAFALSPIRLDAHGMRLVVSVHPGPMCRTSALGAKLSLARLAELLPILAENHGPALRLVADPHSGGLIELGRATATVRIDPCQLGASHTNGHGSFNRLHPVRASAEDPR